MSTLFLTLREVLEIHLDQIRRYGGECGIRDMDLLKSALGAPSASFGGDYLHTDIFEMAAAYLFHITQNHPFVDGNKRTGTATAIVFLLMNGWELEISSNKLANTVLEIACGTLSKADMAILLRKHSHKA